MLSGQLLFIFFLLFWQTADRLATTCVTKKEEPEDAFPGILMKPTDG
jgi:hypothetical protein